MTPTVTLDADEAARRLVDWQGLARDRLPSAAAGARALLAHRRCVQLDPLDRIGTNADLVAIARVPDLPRGAIYDALLPGHAFEHFAKERCLIPASRFPAYRERALQAPWWRLDRRLARLPAGLIEEVFAEVEARGPLTPDELQDRGRVRPLDWSGWKGTSKATTMALEVLWTRCRVVVCGRTPRGKRYDLPARALPEVATRPAPADPVSALLLDRVTAAGLLATALGPCWSGLRHARDDGTVDRLVDRGRLVRVRIRGSRREYLADPRLLAAQPEEPDDRMRILGPLDPLLWDRRLVQQVFGFEYAWEVYKPAEKRRWGWYVVPLLHRGRLVGRLEAHRQAGGVVVDRLWREPGAELDRDALDDALARLA